VLAAARGGQGAGVAVPAAVTLMFTTGAELGDDPLVPPPARPAVATSSRDGSAVAGQRSHVRFAVIWAVPRLRVIL